MSPIVLKNVGLFYLSVFILLFLGPNVLHVLGWNIDWYAAPLYQKLRPEFYFLIFLLFRNGGLKKVAQAEKRILIFTVIVFFYWLFTGQYNGFAILINTICIPALISFFCSCLDRKQKNVIQVLILSFFIANSTLAIYERMTNYLFFPYYSAGEATEFISLDYLNMFRSTALRNHPLGNALLTSVILSFIVISDRIAVKWKACLFLLGYVALMCFNARASMMIVPGLLLLYILYNIMVDNVAHISKIKLILAVLAFSIVGIYLFDLGFGGRLLEKGNLSDSSVEARLLLYEKFLELDFSLFLFGMSNNEISNILKLTHIESYWVLYLCRFGIFIFVYYIYAFTKMISEWIKNEKWICRVFVVALLLLLSSTNNSIYGGEPAISVFILCAAALLSTSENQFYNRMDVH